MNPAQPEILDELVELVRASSKYQSISEGLIREVGAKELVKRRNLKEAVKETRTKLHQVGSAFQEKPIPYELWREELNNLPTDINAEESQKFIRACLPMHASTAERLPILTEFFNQTLNSLAPVHSVLDLACGLTPLTLSWMPVTSDVVYSAYDIYEDMTSFIGDFFSHFGIMGRVSVCDLTARVPDDKAQVALLLKTIPCLDQVDKTAAKRLLLRLNCDFILVSFPAHSLGGRLKGMRENYEARFAELVKDENWKISRFEFSSELAFLIEK